MSWINFLKYFQIRLPQGNGCRHEDKDMGTSNYLYTMLICDDKGRGIQTQSKKKLAPEYNDGLETLDYDYNIRGWLLGANNDYIPATATPNFFQSNLNGMS